VGVSPTAQTGASVSVVSKAKLPRPIPQDTAPFAAEVISIMGVGYAVMKERNSVLEVVVQELAFGWKVIREVQLVSLIRRDVWQQVEQERCVRRL